MEWMETFINEMLAFKDSGIYDFVTESFAYFIESMTLLLFDYYYEVIKFSWDVSLNIMEDLGFSAMLSNMFSHFDSAILDLLLFFRVPEVVSVIVNAYITRYVMSWIPYSGIG